MFRRFLFIQKTIFFLSTEKVQKSQNFRNAGTVEAHCHYCFQKHTCKQKFTNKCRNIYQEDDMSFSKTHIVCDDFKSM